MAGKGSLTTGMTAYPVNGPAGAGAASKIAAAEKAGGGAGAAARARFEKQAPKDIASNVAGSPAAPIASEMAGAGQAIIAHHMGGQRAHVSHAQALRLLNEPGTAPTTQKRTVYLNTRVTLREVIEHPELARLKMKPVAADLFKKPVYNAETKTTDMLGDVKNSQVTEIQLLSYTNKLPVDIGLESFEVLGNIAPRVISGENGRLFTCILSAETSEAFSKPRLLHKNDTVINPKTFSMWSGVTKEQLLEGSHPHPLNPELIFVELVKNKRMKTLLKTNLKRLEKDFESFNYHEMAHELNLSNGAHTVICREGHEKLVEIGLKLGINPVQESSVSLYDLAFQAISTTSPTGNFSDLKSILVAEYGKDLADEILDQSYAIKAAFEISAVVSGTEPESEEEAPKKRAAAAAEDDGSGSESENSRASTPAASDSEHSAASSDAE